MNVIICDIDNCIAHDEWRIPFINWAEADLDKRFHAYHTLSVQDEACTLWLSEAVQNLEANHIHFFTARGTRYAAQTHHWLREVAGFKPFEYSLHMRNNADHRSSVLLKEEMLLNLNHHDGVRRADIVAAYDDRADIVEMYRANDIRSEVRALHSAKIWERGGAPPRTVPELLRAGADTFEQRNALYGDNYKHFGATMSGMFPGGLTLRTAEDWNRAGLLIQCASKLTRYAAQFEKGGHRDSAHDLSVYGAMLQEMTK